MATSKQYAWYLEGSEIAIVEKDVSFDNNVDSKDYGPGASRARWESPQSSVADGLEVKYVYSPTYNIKDISIKSLDTLNTWTTNSGLLAVYDSTSTYTNYGSILDVGDYFVLKNAGRWNGLHKVKSISNAGGTNNYILTETFADSLMEGQIVTFEEAVTLYYSVDVLEDESFQLNLPIYLQKALVYYVKAKLAEDAGELKLREYAMREFRKMIEKHENSRISGLRITSPGSHAIR